MILSIKQEITRFYLPQQKKGRIKSYFVVRNVKFQETVSLIGLTS